MLDLLDMVHLPGLLGGVDDLPVLGGGDVLLISIEGREGAIKPLLLLRHELFLLLVSGDAVDDLGGVLVLVLDLLRLPDPKLNFTFLPVKISFLGSAFSLSSSPLIGSWRKNP